jgi:hypothetical protein
MDVWRNPVPNDMRNARVTSTVHTLCCSYAFQQSFQLLVTQRCELCRKFLVSLESPDRHSLLVAVMPLSN